MTPSTQAALRRLGWGLVFPVIDVHIVYFDVLPDFVGYILICSAAGQLSSERGRFKLVRYLSAILTLLSLPSLVLKLSVDLNGGGFSAMPLGMHLYGQGMTLLHLLLAYSIFQGLYELARPVATPELLDAITARRKLYVCIAAVQLIFYPFLYNIEQSWIMLLLLLGVLRFIAELLLFRLPFRMSHLKTESA